MAIRSPRPVVPTPLANQGVGHSVDHNGEAQGIKEKPFEYQGLCRFINTLHRAKGAFIIALGIDTEGYRHVLGFWQGATENHEICEAFLADIELSTR